MGLSVYPFIYPWFITSKHHFYQCGRSFMAICVCGSSHQDICICIIHSETFLRSHSCFLFKIIAGKAIMCSLEWPHLSPLQAVHSHQSLWTFIPYLAMRLPPYFSNLSPYKSSTQFIALPTLGIPSISLETHIHPSILPSYSVQSPRTFLCLDPNDS